MDNQLNNDDRSSVSCEMRDSTPRLRPEKFKQVLLYLLGKCGAKPNVGETALYKLLYFIDFNYYELYEEQLTGLTYRKLQFGPVPKEFRALVAKMSQDEEVQYFDSHYGGYPQTRYIPLVDADLTKLTPAEIGVIDVVVDRLSDKSANYLSDYSHDDMPWKATEDNAEISYELVFYRMPSYSVRDYGGNEEGLIGDAV